MANRMKGSQNQERPLLKSNPKYNPPPGSSANVLIREKEILQLVYTYSAWPVGMSILRRQGKRNAAT